MRVTFRNVMASVLVVASSSANIQAEDWPGWMGPNRDGVTRESGLVESIPAGGLKVEWRVPIGGGYAGPAVAAGRVYVADYIVTSGKTTNNPGGRDAIEGTERILCLDSKTGKELWQYKYNRPYLLSYANGPRATPTVEGDTVYALGAEGDLVSLGASDGQLLWKKSLPKEYKSETPIWGHSAAPLVYEDLLICLAGGPGSVVVAFDKKTGAEKWKALTASEIGYCAPSIITVGTEKQLLIWDAENINGLDPRTGKVFWSAPLKPSYGMAIAIPQMVGRRLFASGIGEVGAMFELAEDGRSIKELWRGKTRAAVYSANAPAKFVGDAIYGADNGSGLFVAVNAKDGVRFWETYEPTSGGTRRASHGTAFVTRIGETDRYWIFSETGDLILAELTPKAYKEIGRSHVIDPSNDAFGRAVVWSYPAYAEGHAFIRSDKEIVSVNISRSAP